MRKATSIFKKYLTQIRLFMCVWLSLYAINQAQAQFVELPDTNFRNELRNLYPECFNTSGFLDTSCASVANAKVLKINVPFSDYITNVSGLAYFKSLEDLDLTGNNTLTTIPVFPEKLRRFTCVECDLEELPLFNDSLRTLNLSGNDNLRCLNILPPNLDSLLTYDTDVECIPNLIGGLVVQPNLPICQNSCDPYYDLYKVPDENFKRYLERWIPHAMVFGKLDTNYNKFMAPALIDFLSFDVGDIFSLDGLQYLSSITTIFATNQKINFVPDLSNLKILDELHLEFNEIIQIPKLPSSLYFFTCNDNQLQSLPELPEALVFFSCHNNQLSSLPTLPKGLTHLNCDGNPLTCLPNLPSGIVTMGLPLSIECLPNDVQVPEYDFLPLCTDTLAICDFRRCDSTLCVLPGDADHDRTVNNFDIFGIGLSYNRTGQERPAGSDDYQLQPTLEWNSTHYYGFNDKFTDCNGDGVINDADALVVDQNYIAQEHNIYSYRTPEEDSVPAVFLVFDNAPTFTFNGTCTVAEVVGDIMVGTPTNAAENLYGMAFSVEYPAEFVSPDCMSVTVELDPDSWFQTNDPVLLFYKNIPEFHRVDIAVTRTDGQPRSGNGRVGKIKLITEGDIFGVQRGGNYTFDFDVKDVAGIDTSGQDMDFSGLPVTQEFIVTQITNPKIEDLRMYPNPAADALRVQAKETISSIRVYDIAGNLLMEQTGEQNAYVFNLSNIAPGVLMVEIKSKDAVEYVKIVKR